MRFWLGIFIGVFGLLGVFGFLNNPDRFYPFSEQWTSWSVFYAREPNEITLRLHPIMQTRLVFYPLVSCEVRPFTDRQYTNQLLANVDVYGREFLPFLEAPGWLRLQSACRRYFSETYPTSESVGSLTRQQL